MKKVILKINFILSQFGFNPIMMIRSIRGLGSYVAEYLKFRKQYNSKINFYPCLHDRYNSTGAICNESFWRDLIVAQMVFDNKPKYHLDIGSRIDGFVAHVTSFRKLMCLM